jgi:hypothetical protein
VSAGISATAEPQDAAAIIASQYLDALPEHYASRYSVIGDPDTLGILFKAASAGLSEKDSALAAGVSTRTLNRWHAQADVDPEGPYGLFVSHLKACRAQGKLKRLEKIEAHGVKEWTALAWMLERTDPEQFALRKDNSDAPKVIVQIGVRDGDVSVSVGELTPPQVAIASASALLSE